MYRSNFYAMGDGPGQILQRRRHAPRCSQLCLSEPPQHLHSGQRALTGPRRQGCFSFRATRAWWCGPAEWQRWVSVLARLAPSRMCTSSRRWNVWKTQIRVCKGHKSKNDVLYGFPRTFPQPFLCILLFTPVPVPSCARTPELPSSTLHGRLSCTADLPQSVVGTAGEDGRGRGSRGTCARSYTPRPPIASTVVSPDVSRCK